MAQSVWQRDDLVNLLAGAELALLQTTQNADINADYLAGYLAALATVARSLGVKTTPSRHCEVVRTLKAAQDAGDDRPPEVILGPVLARAGIDWPAKEDAHDRTA